MSAIAGYWNLDGQPSAETFCRGLIHAQARYGPHRQDLMANGAFAAGRCLYRLLPEDSFDRQPLRSEDGRITLVADLRLDNRDELIEGLRLGSSAGSLLSDADLLLRSYLAWRHGVLDRLLGDFAFAIWDSGERALLLARDATGERPLHYRAGRGFFAFASMPLPLGALPGQRCQVDQERMAQFVADVPHGGARSFFEDVRKVEPGHFVKVTDGGIAARRYWDPRRTRLKQLKQADYGEALREQLDRAVARRLRRTSGLVGSQLSSGLDSSAVTSSAGLLLAGRGERLLAFTSAPRPDFDGPLLPRCIADESGIAAQTAALHPNVEHLVVRPDGVSPLSLLEPAHLLAHQPVGHVANNGWWESIGQLAGARGVGVMLTGELGNFSISAGAGLDGLADLAGICTSRQWLREARALRSRALSWPSIFNATIGPHLPKKAYEFLRGERVEAPSFVAAPWQREMQHQLRTKGWPTQPPKSSHDGRWTMLRMADAGNYRKRALASWGIDERDATADRRLIEFSFSLPVEAFLKDGNRRPALQGALNGRVPDAVLRPPLRGVQSADWYEQMRGEEVLAFTRELAARGGADRVVDLASVEVAAAAWPDNGSGDPKVVYQYSGMLLRALSAAQFMTGVGQARNG